MQELILAGQSWSNWNTLVGSDMWGNPGGCFAWNAVEKVRTWGMALGQVGTPSTRAVSLSPLKLCSVIMVMAMFYLPSPFLFFFPLRWWPALHIIIWVWSHPWIRGLSTVFVSFHPVPLVFWHRGWVFCHSCTVSWAQHSAVPIAISIPFFKTVIS